MEIGLDEVGRGCLAGPVVACAIAWNEEVEARLQEDNVLEWVKDSKALTAIRRKEIAHYLKSVTSFALGWVSARDIDRLNIRRASHLAMEIALTGLLAQIDFRKVSTVLIDGHEIPTWSQDAFRKEIEKLSPLAVIGGDALHRSISGASVIAKVARDEWMIGQAQSWPRYGFDKHKGYPTKFHREALSRLGATPLHRKSFHGVEAGMG